jgi:ribosome-associated protein
MLIKEAAEEKKAYDIKILEVSAVTVLTDFFLVCSSDSNVQSRAIADSIADMLEENGRSVASREGYQKGDWVVIDTGRVIVHIFTPEVREHYNLERFWEHEIERVQQGASDNLSGLIKTRKAKPVVKPAVRAAGSKKTAGDKKDGRKSPAASKRGEKTAVKTSPADRKKTAAASKTPVKRSAPVNKKEEIEREIIKKAKPVKKTILTKEKSSEKSRKQLVEEEIMRMKQKREENRVKQVAKNKSGQATEFRPGAKNAAKKMRDAASFASKAMSKAGSMSAIKSKKGAKK